MKGTCPVCKQYRWLGGRGKICKPCGYKMGICCKCKKKRKIYVNGLCYVCYEDRLVRAKISALALSSNDAYQHHLFELYLTYIRRYYLKYHHLRQAKQLRRILEKRPLAPIHTWTQIYAYDNQYPLPHKPGSKKGNAIVKIGYMLQELGVLPPREDDLGRQLNNLLDHFSTWEKQWICPFIDLLKNQRLTQASIHHYLHALKNFSAWLKTSRSEFNLLNVNRNGIEKFLLSLQAQQSHIIHNFYALHKFYRYAKLQKWVLGNPCHGFCLSNLKPKLCICSDSQIRKLGSFIKNTDSNPESAMILALILFFAFTTEDLTFATLDTKNEHLTIILRRKNTSRGKRFYNREQLLKLPQTPHWFYQLQKRFYEHWHLRYRQMKKTYPHKPILFTYHNTHNRPLSTTTVRKRIRRATMAATGSYIPARILRQTSGHMHTHNGDASLLSRLGWSPHFAFCYTYLPRTFFLPSIHQL